MPSFLILILLFGLPFVIGPIGISFFETPKIYATIFLIEIVTLVSIWKMDIKQKFVFSKFDYTLFSLFAFVIFLYLFSPTPLSFYGNEFRKQGVFLLLHLVVFSFIASRLPQIKEKLFRICSRISLLTLFISTFLFGTTLDERAVGIFGEPNSLGLYATFAWPFTGSYFFALPAIGIILMSGSRSAFVAFLIQIMFLFLTKRFRVSQWVAALCSSFVLFLSLLLPFFEQTAEYQNRPLIWKTAFTGAIEKSFVGWGYGNTELALAEGARKLENPLRFVYIDSSHNLFLDWFIQGGIVGLTLLIVVIGFTFKNLIFGKQNNPFLVSYLALFVGLLFNPVSVAILIPFWWIVGVSNRMNNAKKDT